MPTHDSMTGIRDRFADEAERYSQALRRLGVDARVGEVPGESCQGEFSVNARGAKKLVGAAQRIVRGGWLFSTVVVVGQAGRVRDVLEDVYADLGLQWEPRTVGSIADEAPGVSIEDVEHALLGIYSGRYHLAAATITAQELATATELLSRHRVRV
jgi:octanoyl-[GcvH]:protein N-octanoyltransferase